MTKHTPSSTIHVGINGFGRIGRIIFRASLEYDQLHVSAINDPNLDANYITYLIKYDSAHGKFNGSIQTFKKGILVNGKKVKIFNNKGPQDIPWHSAAVDYVVDASGVFTTLKQASLHLQGTPKSVKRVFVAAPSVDLPTIIRGVNHELISSDMEAVSCASTTLCSLAPLVKVLDDNFGVVEGMVTVLQSLAQGSKTADGPHFKSKGMCRRERRGGPQNIVPSVSGACRALGRVLPHLENKFAGIAYRVPIADVSLLDLTVRLGKDTTISEIKNRIVEASITNMKDIIRASDEESVSSDFKGDKHSCVVDFNSSLQLNPTFYKFVCWYDNEYAYACRIVELIVRIHDTVDLLIPIRSLSVITAICTTALNKISKLINSNTQIKKSIITSNNVIDDKLNSFKELVNKSKKNKKLRNSQTQTQSSWSYQSQYSFNNPIIRGDVIQENQYNVNCKEYYILPRAKPFTNHFLASSKKFKSDSEMESYILWQTVNECNETSEEQNEPKAPARSGNNRKFSKKNHKHSNSTRNKNRNRRKYMFAHNILSDLLNLQNCGAVKTFNMTNSEIPLSYRKNYSKPGKNMNISGTDIYNTIIEKEINFVYKSMHEINTTDDDIDKTIENEQRTGIMSKKEYNVPSLEHSELSKVTSEEENRIYYVGEPKRSDKEFTHDNQLVKVEEQNISLEKQMHSKLKCMNKFKQKNELSSSNIKTTTETKEMVVPKVSPLTFDYVNELGSLRRNINSLNLSDKLESASGSDSGCSVNFLNKKSIEINLCDIADSVEDLDQLDQICKIIEISDELTDQLFLHCENKKIDIESTNWSVKKFCERVQFDEFLKGLSEK